MNSFTYQLLEKSSNPTWMFPTLRKHQDIILPNSLTDGFANFVNPMSYPFSIFPTPLILSIISPSFLTQSIFFVFRPLPYILITVGPMLHTIPIRFRVKPFAFVTGSIFQDLDTKTVVRLPCPLSCVHIAV